MAQPCTNCRIVAGIFLMVIDVLVMVFIGICINGYNANSEWYQQWLTDLARWFEPVTIYKIAVALLISSLVHFGLLLFALIFDCMQRCMACQVLRYVVWIIITLLYTPALVIFVVIAGMTWTAPTATPQFKGLVSVPFVAVSLTLILVAIVTHTARVRTTKGKYDTFKDEEEGGKYEPPPTPNVFDS